jgi:hypothetical protein
MTCSVHDLFNRYGLKNCKLILIKEYEVVDKEHHGAKEPLWIRKLMAMNKNKPFKGKIKEICRIKVKKIMEIYSPERERNLNHFCLSLCIRKLSYFMFPQST